MNLVNIVKIARGLKVRPASSSIRFINGDRGVLVTLGAEECLMRMCQKHALPGAR